MRALSTSSDSYPRELTGGLLLGAAKPFGALSLSLSHARAIKRLAPQPAAVPKQRACPALAARPSDMASSKAHVKHGERGRRVSRRSNYPLPYPGERNAVARNKLARLYVYACIPRHGLLFINLAVRRTASR